MAILFSENNPTIGLPNITPELAQEIYGYFKNNLDETKIKINHSVRIVYSKQVRAEIQRLENAVHNYMNKAPVSKSDLISSMSSDILDTETVVNDFMTYYDGDIETTPTWDQFKAYFNPKIQNETI